MKAVVTKEDIARAYDGLIAQGEKPTRENIRGLVGGSDTTISRFLKEVTAERAQAPASPEEALQASIEAYVAAQLQHKNAANMELVDEIGQLRVLLDDAHAWRREEQEAAAKAHAAELATRDQRIAFLMAQLETAELRAKHAEEHAFHGLGRIDALEALAREKNQELAKLRDHSQTLHGLITEAEARASQWKARCEMQEGFAKKAGDALADMKTERDQAIARQDELYEDFQRRSRETARQDKLIDKMDMLISKFDSPPQRAQGMQAANAQDRRPPSDALAGGRSGGATGTQAASGGQTPLASPQPGGPPRTAAPTSPLQARPSSSPGQPAPKT